MLKLLKQLGYCSFVSEGNYFQKICDNYKRLLTFKLFLLLIFNPHHVTYVIWNVVALWCSGYDYCRTPFNKAWTQVLRRFKSCLQRVGDSRWWGSLTMVPAGNKAKRLLSVNHITKTIHHHHHHHQWKDFRMDLLFKYGQAILKIFEF